MPHTFTPPTQTDLVQKFIAAVTFFGKLWLGVTKSFLNLFQLMTKLHSSSSSGGWWGSDGDWNSLAVQRAAGWNSVAVLLYWLGVATNNVRMQETRIDERLGAVRTLHTHNYTGKKQRTKLLHMHTDTGNNTEQGWSSTSCIEFRCWHRLGHWLVTAWEIMVSKMANVVSKNGNKNIQSTTMLLLKLILCLQYVLSKLPYRQSVTSFVFQLIIADNLNRVLLELVLEFVRKRIGDFQGKD